MNKKLHILFLSGWYPSRVRPTSGDFVQRHAEAVATKHQVTVIHVISDEKLKKSIDISESLINNVKTIIVYLPKTYKFIKFINFFKAYTSTIKEVGHFDLVHLNITYPKGLITIYLKWFKKKQYIISEHWTGYQFQRNKSIGLIEKLLSKLIIKNASFICPVSKNLQNEMIAFGLKGNYYSIPNVVDTSFFNISNERNSSFTITHISHMGNEHKNIIGILNVIRDLESKISDLTFNLIGDNSKKYISKINDLNIKNIQIIDQIPNTEVAQYLKKSNVNVLFSNYENLPCVILESFACGVPVVSTNVGGINEYFPENFGYLVSPKDEQAFENSILKIYNSKLNFDKNTMRNYAIKNFSIESICTNFSDLYYKTLFY